MDIAFFSVVAGKLTRTVYDKLIMLTQYRGTILLNNKQSESDTVFCLTYCVSKFLSPTIWPTEKHVEAMKHYFYPEQHWPPLMQRL